MKIRKTTLFFLFLLFVFVVCAIFFSIQLEPGIVPDEPEHFIISKQYAISWGVPADTQETYQFGPMKGRAFLYYWLNGRAINILNFFSPLSTDLFMLIALRLLSVFYATLAVIFCYLLAESILKSGWWALFVVFLLTNTLMFVFLAGGLTYDTLTNLFCFSGIYFWARSLSGKTFITNSMGWLICISAGTLTKFTVLPLAVAMGIFWLIYAIKQRGIIFIEAIPSRWVGVLVVIFFILFGLNFSLYGLNLISYGVLQPSCMQLLSGDLCAQEINAMRAQRFNLTETLSLVDVILYGYPDPLEWFFDFWIADMIKKTFGIVGHKTYLPDLSITFYRLWFLWLGFLAIKYWKRPSSWVQWGLITITVFYVLILLITNYQSELTTGFKHVAIHGRYIFPVIGVLYILAVLTIANSPNSFMRRLTIYLTIFLFLWNNWVSPLRVFLIPTKALPVTSVIIPYIPYYGVPAEKVVGSVYDSNVLSQDFISQCKGTIGQVYLVMRIHNRQSSIPIIVEIMDLATGETIASTNALSSQIVDGSWQPFSFQPIIGTFGKNYQIKVSAPDGDMSSTIGIMGSIMDAFPDGVARLNGNELTGDVSFHYECIQPAFADWFRNR